MHALKKELTEVLKKLSEPKIKMVKNTIQWSLPVSPGGKLSLLWCGEWLHPGWDTLQALNGKWSEILYYQHSHHPHVHHLCLRSLDWLVPDASVPGTGDNRAKSKQRTGWLEAKLQDLRGPTCQVPANVEGISYCNIFQCISVVLWASSLYSYFM